MRKPYGSMQVPEHAFARACLHMVSLTVLDSLHDRKSGFVGDPTNAAQPAQTSASFQSLKMLIGQNELHSLKENTTTPPMQGSASAEQPVLKKTRDGNVELSDTNDSMKTSYSAEHSAI